MPQPKQPVTHTFFCWITCLGGDLATGQGGLYSARSRGQARYLCLLDVQDVATGISFQHIKVRREKAFDGTSFRDGVMPRYVNREAERLPGTAGGEG